MDQRPEELIAATAMGVQVQYAAGLGPSGNSSSLRFSVESIQIDDEIPGTRSDPFFLLAFRMPCLRVTPSKPMLRLSGL